MAAGKRRMKLTGLKQPVALQKHFACYMVDVAYVIEIAPDSVIVEMDDGIDLGEKRDRDWAIDLVRGELRNCGEIQAQIEVLD